MKADIKVVVFLFLLCCSRTVQAQTDSVKIQRDSAVTIETDPTVVFFQQNEKVTAPAKLVLITKTGKTTNLAAFLKDIGQFSDHVLADMDGDNKKELLIHNYTGGAHCCDELYFFKNTGPGKYQQTAKLFAGNTIITPEKKFEFDLYEQFGYFFTCYACSYEDTTDEAPVPVHSILLRYAKGTLQLVPPDKDLRSVINDNLAKLGEQPYQKPDESSFDNGLRKEIALNLAVYYYSFGKNIAETQKLFNKYYKFPDAKKVWAEFVKNLGWIKKENSF